METSKALAAIAGDRAFAMEVLESRHSSAAPGSSFKSSYSDHLRITTLPDAEQTDAVLGRIDSLLLQYSSA